jgi:hypothetical protein
MGERMISSHEWGHSMSLAEHYPELNCSAVETTVMAYHPFPATDPCVSTPTGRDFYSVDCIYVDAFQITLPDCDGDGFSDEVEEGFPLCYLDNQSDDSFEDAIVDDGCLQSNHTPQVGAYEENEFRLGTFRFGRCGFGINYPNGFWPLDFVGGGVPSSTNRITFTDLTSFLAPAPRKFNTSPGDLGFNKRWDLVPGPGLFLKWINIQDLMAMIAGPTAFPPMFGGQRAFGGPACSGHPYYVF